MFIYWLQQKEDFLK